ncbi:hypothetical protein A2U01_0115498 [Trifolium medium]|uniref:Uncharacterized protein n=1 Tax=Trifolium medium TaxID=97028 RepID=A0A392W689_9FABA|nr:hypothetical protein [Trifolium medium]
MNVLGETKNRDESSSLPVSNHRAGRIPAAAPLCRNPKNPKT